MVKKAMKLAAVLMMSLALLASCDIKLDGSVLDQIEEGLPTITYIDRGQVLETVQSSTLVAADVIPERVGYSFLGWAMSDGGDPVESFGETISEDVTLYAVWGLDETSDFIFVDSSAGNDDSGTGSSEAPYKTIGKAIAQSGDDVSILASGSFSENINIPAGASVTIAGMSTVGPVAFNEDNRAIANTEEGYDTIVGNITMGAGATLKLADIAIKPDSGNAISSSEGVTISLDHVLIVNASGGRSINIVPTDAKLTQNVDVSLTSSALVITGTSTNDRGINIDGDDTQRTSATVSVDLSLIDSSIIQSGERGLVYPINIFRVDQADLAIDNSIISIVSNYYAFRFFDVGSEAEKSTVTITDSTLEAWAAVYLQACSENVDVTVTGSILDGSNYNSGDTNGFAVVAVDSTREVNVNVVDSVVRFGMYGEADQQAAAIYYYDHPFIADGGNSINFRNCHFVFTGDNPHRTGLLSFAENYHGFTKDGGELQLFDPVPQANIITFDDATMADITAQGYIYETSETEIDGLDMYNWPSRDSFDESTLYYGVANEYRFAYADGVEKGFASGAGTQQHPYIIRTAEQLMKIDGQAEGKYYRLEDDITITDGEANIQSFTGVLDGNGHSITLETVDPRGNVLKACGLIMKATDAEFRNLDFHTTGIKALVVDGYGSVTFDNVDVYGEIELIDNNVAGYLVYANREASVRFNGCTSYANYIDTDGTHYGAHFLAYYPLGSNVTISFVDCTVEGDFLAGRAAALVGNPSQISSWGDNVSVENLVINGDIKSYDNRYPAGIVSWGTGAETYNDAVEDKTTINGSLETLSDSISSSISEDGHLSFKWEGSGSVDHFRVLGMADIKYLEGTDYVAMHRTWSLVMDEQDGVYQSCPEGGVDISHDFVVDETYEQLPENADGFMTFTVQGGEETYTCHYIPNNEPYSYGHAYLGTIVSGTGIQKDEDGAAPFQSFSVTAYDSEGAVIGIDIVTNTNTPAILL